MSVTLSSCSPVFVKAVFTGRNGAGSISVPGVKAGDMMFWLQGNTINSFEGNGSITVDDQIQQISASDLSALTFTLICVRWS